MTEAFPFEPLDGVVQKHDNDLAHTEEERIFLYDIKGNIIGRATSLNRTTTSSYKWLMVDVMCNRPLSARIMVAKENWCIDAVIFHEGYGYLTTTAQTKPVKVIPPQTFLVTYFDEIPTKIDNLFLYRYVTVETCNNEEEP